MSLGGKKIGASGGGQSDPQWGDFDVNAILADIAALDASGLEGAPAAGAPDSALNALLDEFTGQKPPRAPDSGQRQAQNPLLANSAAELKQLILDLDTSLKQMPDYISRRPVHKELLRAAARLFYDPDPDSVRDFEREVIALEDEVEKRENEIVSREIEIDGMKPMTRSTLARDLRRRLEKLERSRSVDFRVFIRNFGGENGGVTDLIKEAKGLYFDPVPIALQKLEQRVEHLENYERLLKELDEMLAKSPDLDELENDPAFRRILKSEPEQAGMIRNILEFVIVAGASDRSLPTHEHLKDAPRSARRTKFERLSADPNFAHHPKNFGELAERIEDYELMLSGVRFREFVAGIEMERNVASEIADMQDEQILARQDIVRFETNLRLLDDVISQLAPPKGKTGVTVTAGWLSDLCDDMEERAGEVFDELGSAPRVVIQQGDEVAELRTGSPSGAFEIISDSLADHKMPDYGAEKTRLLGIVRAVSGRHKLSNADPDKKIPLDGEELRNIRAAARDIAHYEGIRLKHWLNGQTEGLDEHSRERLEAALAVSANLVEEDDDGDDSETKSESRAIADLIMKNPDALHRMEMSLSVENLLAYAKILDTKFPGGLPSPTSQGTFSLNYERYTELVAAFREEAERLEREILAHVPPEEKARAKEKIASGLRGITTGLTELPEGESPAQIELTPGALVSIHDCILTLIRFENELLRLTMKKEEERLRSLGATKEDLDTFDSRIEKIFSAGRYHRFDELKTRVETMSREFENLEFRLSVRWTRDILSQTENVKKLVMAAEVFGLKQVDEENFAVARATLGRVLAYLDAGRGDEAKTLYAAFVSSPLYAELIEALQRAKNVAIADELTAMLAVSIVVVMSAGFLSELAPAWIAGYIGRASKIKRIGLAFASGAAFDNATRAIRHVALNEPYFHTDNYAEELAWGALEMTGMLTSVGVATRASFGLLNAMARTKPRIALLLRYPLPFAAELDALVLYGGITGYARISMLQGHYDPLEAAAHMRLALTPMEIAKTGLFLGGLRGGRLLASPLSPIGGAARAAISGHHAQRLARMDRETEKILDDREVEGVTEKQRREMDRRLEDIQRRRILVLERELLTEEQIEDMPEVTEKDKARKEATRRQQEVLRREIARQPTTARGIEEQVEARQHPPTRPMAEIIAEHAGPERKLARSYIGKSLGLDPENPEFDSVLDSRLGELSPPEVVAMMHRALDEIMRDYEKLAPLPNDEFLLALGEALDVIEAASRASYPALRTEEQAAAYKAAKDRSLKIEDIGKARREQVRREKNQGAMEEIQGQVATGGMLKDLIDGHLRESEATGEKIAYQTLLARVFIDLYRMVFGKNARRDRDSALAMTPTFLQFIELIEAMDEGGYPVLMRRLPIYVEARAAFAMPARDPAPSGREAGKAGRKLPEELATAVVVPANATALQHLRTAMTTEERAAASLSALISTLAKLNVPPMPDAETPFTDSLDGLPPSVISVVVADIENRCGRVFDPQNAEHMRALDGLFAAVGFENSSDFAGRMTSARRSLTGEDLLTQVLWMLDSKLRSELYDSQAMEREATFQPLQLIEAYILAIADFVAAVLGTRTDPTRLFLNHTSDERAASILEDAFLKLMDEFDVGEQGQAEALGRLGNIIAQARKAGYPAAVFPSFELAMGRFANLYKLRGMFERLRAERAAATSKQATKNFSAAEIAERLAEMVRAVDAGIGDGSFDLGNAGDGAYARTLARVIGEAQMLGGRIETPRWCSLLIRNASLDKVLQDVSPAESGSLVNAFEELIRLVPSAPPDEPARADGEGEPDPGTTPVRWLGRRPKRRMPPASHRRGRPRPRMTAWLGSVRKIPPVPEMLKVSPPPSDGSRVDIKNLASGLAKIAKVFVPASMVSPVDLSKILGKRNISEKEFSEALQTLLDACATRIQKRAWHDVSRSRDKPDWGRLGNAELKRIKVVKDAVDAASRGGIRVAWGHETQYSWLVAALQARGGNTVPPAMSTLPRRRGGGVLYASGRDPYGESDPLEPGREAEKTGPGSDDERLRINFGSQGAPAAAPAAETKTMTVAEAFEKFAPRSTHGELRIALLSSLKTIMSGTGREPPSLESLDSGRLAAVIAATFGTFNESLSNLPAASRNRGSVVVRTLALLFEFVDRLSRAGFEIPIAGTEKYQAVKTQIEEMARAAARPIPPGSPAAASVRGGIDAKSRHSKAARLLTKHLPRVSADWNEKLREELLRAFRRLKSNNQITLSSITDEELVSVVEKVAGRLAGEIKRAARRKKPARRQHRILESLVEFVGKVQKDENPIRFNGTKVRGWRQRLRKHRSVARTTAGKHPRKAPGLAAKSLPKREKLKTEWQVTLPQTPENVADANGWVQIGAVGGRILKIRIDELGLFTDVFVKLGDAQPPGDVELDDMELGHLSFKRGGKGGGYSTDYSLAGFVHLRTSASRGHPRLITDDMKYAIIHAVIECFEKGREKKPAERRAASEPDDASPPPPPPRLPSRGAHGADGEFHTDRIGPLPAAELPAEEGVPREGPLANLARQPDAPQSAKPDTPPAEPAATGGPVEKTPSEDYPGQATVNHHLATKRYAQALALLESILARNDLDANQRWRALLDQGITQRKNRRTAESIRSLREAARLAGGNGAGRSRPHRELALSLLTQAERPTLRNPRSALLVEALKEIGKAIELEPGSPYNHSIRAEILYAQHSTNEAHAENDIAVKLADEKGSNSPQVIRRIYHTRAKILLRKGQTIGALEAVNRALTAQPDSNRDAALKAEILIKLAASLKDARPGDAVDHLLEALALLEKAAAKQPLAAAQHCEDIIDALLRLAHLHENDADKRADFYNRALRALQELRHLRPNDSLFAMLYDVEILIGLGRNAEAIEAARRMPGSRDNTSQPYRRAAELMMTAGQHSLAITLAYKAKNAEPLDPRNHERLVETYEAAGKLQEAETAAQDGIELLESERGRILYVVVALIRVRLKMGKRDHALETVNRALNNGFSPYVLARAYETAGVELPKVLAERITPSPPSPPSEDPS